MKFINTYPESTLFNTKYFQYIGYDELNSFLKNSDDSKFLRELIIDGDTRKVYYKENRNTLILIREGDWIVLKGYNSYPDYHSSCKIITNDEFIKLDLLNSDYYPLAQELYNKAVANINWKRYNSDCDAYGCSCSDPEDHVLNDIRKTIELTIKNLIK